MTELRGSETLPDPIAEAAQDWFLRLASGAATEADLAGFRAWRDADPRHADAFEEVRDLWNDIDALEPAFAPGKEPGTANRADVQTRRPTTQGRRVVVWGGLVAACLAFLAVFLTDLSILLKADHSTGAGEQAEVRLPDGSTAYLNTDSALALSYSESGRQVVLLRGEAFFEVARDAARPFAVQALEGRTTAVGTAFAVRLRADTAVVTVTEGRVRVVAPSAAASGETLAAGQQVAYREGASPGRVGTVDAIRATAWRQGAIVIDNRPLAEAIAEIDRYRPGRILLLRDTSQLSPITARLSVASLDSGLRALAATHGLKVTQVTDYLVILR